MQLCRNQDGKLYENGRKYPKLLREEVLDLNHDGMSQRAIARELKTSRCFVQNVLADYDHTGSSLQHLRDPPERRIMNPEVISCIETEKLMKPSVYVRELQDRLLLDGVVHLLDLPSKCAISKCISAIGSVYQCHIKVSLHDKKENTANTIRITKEWQYPSSK